MAEKLDIPQVTYVTDFVIADDKKSVTVKRALEDGYEEIKVQMPCLLTAIKELNEPRYMSVNGIFKSVKKDITVWNAADLGVTRYTGRS